MISWKGLRPLLLLLFLMFGVVLYSAAVYVQDVSFFGSMSAYINSLFLRDDVSVVARSIDPLAANPIVRIDTSGYSVFAPCEECTI